MELSARVSKNLSLEIKESVVSGTSGLVIYTRTKDNNNVTIKVPDQVTVVSISDLQLALNEAKTFLGESKSVPMLKADLEVRDNVTSVKNVEVVSSPPTEVEGVVLDFIPSFETEYLAAEGSSSPEFNGN